MEIKILSSEANKVANYLLNYSPKEKEQELYESFIRMKSIALTEKEHRVWSIMLSNKFLFYSFDSGLGFFYPHSAIRHRILCMLGVLEAQPQLAIRFLSEKTSLLLLFIHLVKAFITLPLIIVSGFFLKIYLR